MRVTSRLSSVISAAALVGASLTFAVPAIADEDADQGTGPLGTATTFVVEEGLSGAGEDSEGSNSTEGNREAEGESDSLGGDQSQSGQDQEPTVFGLDTDPMSGGDEVELVDVNLLNINDYHGRIDGKLNETKDALTASSTMQFAYTVEGLRAEVGADKTLFLSAGDNVGASLFASSILQDQPTIDLLNTLQMKATAAGNHEFDAGWDDLRDRLQSEFDGPILAANVFLKSTGELALPAYAEFDVSGLKVAVIGAVTEETPTLVNPANVADVMFTDPVLAVNATANELMNRAEADQPDLIVAEYHEGAPGSSSLADQVANSVVFAQIVNGTSSDVDAIFTGHTHQTYAWEGPVPGDDERTRPVVSTGSYGYNVGQVVLSVDAETGDVDSYTARNVNVAGYAPADMAALRNSPTMEEAYGIILRAIQNADEVGSQPAATLNAPITRAYTNGVYVDGVFARTEASREDRGEASALATLVGNMLVEGGLSELEMAPDFGVANPGGLRTDLIPGENGVITVAQARAVLPFNNELTIVTMTGEQIVTMLEQQWQRTADGEVPSRAYLQLGLSDNFNYTYTEIEDPDNPGQTLGIVDTVLINGNPIDLDATYRAGTFAFLSAGGDNFHVFKETNVLDTGLLDWVSWLGYLEDSSPIDPDFTRAGVQVEGVYGFDSLDVGETVSVMMSRMNVPSVGAPDNTEATLGFAASDFDGPVPVSEITVPITEDMVSAEVVVPDEPGEMWLFAEFAPSMTPVLIPVYINGVVAEPVINLNLDKVAAGSSVVVSGENWEPGETVTLAINPTLGTAVVDEDGAFSLKVTIPTDLKPGDYMVTATSGDLSASAPLTVTAAPAPAPDNGGGGGGGGKLPQTGSTVMLMLLLAAGATAGGTALVRGSRKRV